LEYSDNRLVPSQLVVEDLHSTLESTSTNHTLMHEDSSNMSKRNLLLCFDAFGTLFTPKRPIAQQYGEVARSLGLGGFSDEQVQTSFKDGVS